MQHCSLVVSLFWVQQCLGLFYVFISKIRYSCSSARESKNSERSNIGSYLYEGKGQVPFVHVKLFNILSQNNVEWVTLYNWFLRRCKHPQKKKEKPTHEKLVTVEKYKWGDFLIRFIIVNTPGLYYKRLYRKYNSSFTISSFACPVRSIIRIQYFETLRP